MVASVVTRVAVPFSNRQNLVIFFSFQMWWKPLYVTPSIGVTRADDALIVEILIDDEAVHLP
jgi:hypothetical protein